MKTIFCLVLSLVLISCGESTEKKEYTEKIKPIEKKESIKKEESTENIGPIEKKDENVTFENVSESQIQDRIKNWLKKLNLKEDQKIRVEKVLLDPSDPLEKPKLQLQFQQADLDGTYPQILAEMRVLAGASDKEMGRQSDGFIEMTFEVAERLIKALFKK